MLSFTEIQDDLHRPCLLLGTAHRKSLHDLTRTSEEKLLRQTYKVFHREDHDLFTESNQ